MVSRKNQFYKEIKDKSDPVHITKRFEDELVRRMLTQRQPTKEQSRNFDEVKGPKRVVDSSNPSAQDYFLGKNTENRDNFSDLSRKPNNKMNKTQSELNYPQNVQPIQQDTKRLYSNLYSKVEKSN